MNHIIIQSVPPGDFEDISIHMPDWQARFLKLIQDEKLIKYNVNRMPNLSKEIEDELSERGYRDLILDSDKNRHFLATKTTSN